MTQQQHPEPPNPKDVPIDEITELARVEPGFLFSTTMSRVEAAYHFDSEAHAENFVATVEMFKPDIRQTTGCIDITTNQVTQLVTVTIVLPS